MHLTLFNWADYTILGIIAVSMLISLIRGFIREALSLASWGISIWVGIKFCAMGAVYLNPYINNNTVKLAVAFFIIFLTCLIIGTIISFSIATLAHKTGLSGTDRVLGLFFGVARGILLVAVLLLIANLAKAPQEEWWTSSLLIPRFQPMVVWLKDLLPDNIQTEVDGIVKPSSANAMDVDGVKTSNSNAEDKTGV